MKDNLRIKTFSDLLTASAPVKWTTLVTSYRIIVFPVLLLLIFTHRIDIFKWLLVVCFLTDMIDGQLARRFNASSILGSKLDSIGDDLTIVAATVGLWVYRSDFLIREWVIFAIPLGLFFLQVSLAFVRYHKMSSFHTYVAKGAAFCQGFFLCSMFLFDTVSYGLFYFTATITTIDLVEEIILVLILREWKTNVKGIYWVVRKG